MTWRFGEVSFFSTSIVYLPFSNFDFVGKLLQAVAALNHASALNRGHPELHIRLIDLKQTGKLVSSHDLSIQLTFYFGQHLHYGSHLLLPLAQCS